MRTSGFIGAFGADAFQTNQNLLDFLTIYHRVDVLKLVNNTAICLSFYAPGKNIA